MGQSLRRYRSSQRHPRSGNGGDRYRSLETTFAEGQGLDALELLASETWSECRDGTSCLERYDSQTEKAEEGDNQEVDVQGIYLLAAQLLMPSIFSQRD